MPRPSLGARLWFDEEAGTWAIRDGTYKRRTRCGKDERDRAEAQFQEYLAEKHTPVSDSRPSKVLVADALKFYLREVVPGQKSKTDLYNVGILEEWWGDKTLADIKTSSCNDYVKHRTSEPDRRAKTAKGKQRRASTQAAARELVTLRAAINAYHAENTLDALPIVAIPKAAPAREVYFQRGEAAAFLRGIREVEDKEARVALRRFFLIGVYTGTRSGALYALSWLPSISGGWVDLKTGLLHRRAQDEAVSKKRKPICKIPVRLLGSLRRWHAADGGASRIVHYGGLPLKKQRRAWDVARRAAGLGPEYTPHILRHTAATWLMEEGRPTAKIAEFLGMSEKVLLDVYGHHHPDHQKDIADGFGRRKGGGGR